ncbi:MULTISPECIES: long-chain-fatty-acid--CoA ligase [Rhodomicrobium]|uniref:long-chain-fatty-acid--CoA ligase n=1 Tax=Rhodomicrobium TaxID=1068 RepID=UPI001AEC858F|nr:MULTISPECIES: long-chain-fatty-acid--CoA ligase [Rhodomicrobium]
MGNINLSPGLEKRAANYVPLTPLEFLRHAATIYPNKTGVVHGQRRLSWGDVYRRARALASGLERMGVGHGEVVSIIAANTPAMIEAHFGVPGAGAVLNTINIRLDAATIAYILDHAESRVLLVDTAFAEVARAAVDRLAEKPRIIEIDDLGLGPAGLGEIEYEAFLAAGDATRPFTLPDDEWDAISVNYTSGTTGHPKGVVYHHRGAYLNALGSALTFSLKPESVYLWTLPLFHCNGWSYCWAVTALGAQHVCLRQFDPALVFKLIEEHRVSHICGAPVILSGLVHAPAEAKRRFGHGTVEVATGGAAPPSAVIAQMEEMGFNVTHLYGMTESYGPSTVCAFHEEWRELPLAERAAKMARQGVPIVTHSAADVLDVATGEPLPADGVSIGEVVMRANTIMRGYLKNPEASDEALRDGWLHSGDLGVMHPDGYIEMKDRAKDIIISGGENIASLEIEEVLYSHPMVVEAAVVARPDEKWGESPCAFILLKPEAAGTVSAEDMIAYCRQNMASFKIPKTIIFGPLPKTATGKIQKFVLRDQARAL